MIDIFNPDLLKRCYSVFVLHHAGGRSMVEVKKKILGIGCADEAEGGWIRAYDRARRIAEQFMTITLDRSTSFSERFESY